MWFCTAQEGLVGLHWATAELENGEWGNWMIADFQPDFEVGELHITADGTALYFHSSRAGGKGIRYLGVQERRWRMAGAGECRSGQHSLQ